MWRAHNTTRGPLARESVSETKSVMPTDVFRHRYPRCQSQYQASTNHASNATRMVNHPAVASGSALPRNGSTPTRDEVAVGLGEVTFAFEVVDVVPVESTV